MDYRPARPGWVYIARTPDGLVKVGFTAKERVHGRVRDFGRGTILLAAVRGTECDEHFVHGILARHHVQWEQFAAAPEVLAFATRLAAEGSPMLDRLRASAFTEAA